MEFVSEYMLFPAYLESHQTLPEYLKYIRSGTGYSKFSSILFLSRGLHKSQQYLVKKLHIFKKASS